MTCSPKNVQITSGDCNFFKIYKLITRYYDPSIVSFEDIDVDVISTKRFFNLLLLSNKAKKVNISINYNDVNND